MLKINEFTICLHCGCSEDIVASQIDALKPLGKKYTIHWNNRIDRWPHMYPTYSELINHSVVTSPTEWIVLINDRCSPTVEEVEKMIDLLENGMSCVLLYNVGFMGFSKELIRTIGWWDQRFIQGWEDRDWVWRIKLANLAMYESQESKYDYSWRSPLNHPPGQCREEHLSAKYRFSDTEVLKCLKEEEYPAWDNFLGSENLEIRESWNEWSESILGVEYNRPNSGKAGSWFVSQKDIKELK
jgi:hypothetical protein